MSRESAFLEREMWFATRIAERTVGRFECPIFRGTTDRAMRSQRVRALILQYRLADLRLFAEKPDTFQSLFAEIYGQSLLQSGVAA